MALETTPHVPIWMTPPGFRDFFDFVRRSPRWKPACTDFRVWNSKIEIALAPSKMSFITSSKKVFCVESESRFEKNIIFYEKIIFANFIIDFASKFSILGLESTKKSKIWDKNRKNDFSSLCIFEKDRESESEKKSFLLLATKLISLRNI